MIASTERRGFVISPPLRKGDITIRNLQDLEASGIRYISRKFIEENLPVGYRFPSNQLVDLHPSAPRDYFGPVAEDGWPISESGK